MFNRSYFIALSAWGLCVVASVFIIRVGMGGHWWAEDDLVWIAELLICGFVVVMIVAKLSVSRAKIAGTVIGFVCGLLPSAALLGWVALVRPGFEASAGTAGFAYVLALPSGIGGAIAGLICSGHRDKLVHPRL
jgi:hypothetical protein